MTFFHCRNLWDFIHICIRKVRKEEEKRKNGRRKERVREYLDKKEMLKCTIRCLAPAKNNWKPRTTATTSPSKLLGFTPGQQLPNNLQQQKRPIDHGKLTEFLRSSLNIYPINLIVVNKTRALSYPLKKLVSDIDSIQYTSPSEDPNDLPLLIDYKVIDYTKNKPLHRTFREQYKHIKGLEKHNIVIISFTKEGLETNTGFISSFKKNYSDDFKVAGCIVNTHTYPYLRDISRSKKDNVSGNMYNIAALGLVRVEKLNDGSLVLTGAPSSSS